MSPKATVFFHFTWNFLLLVLGGLDGPCGGSFDEPGDGSFDGPGDWSVISGVGSETGPREGADVALSPVWVLTSSEAPSLPLWDSAENSVCCPFSRRSRFFGGMRVCLNQIVTWNSPPLILLITQQQGRTEHLIGFDWPMITLLTNIRNSSVSSIYLIYSHESIERSPRSFIFTFYLLAGLQSNSGLWIDDVRLSVCLSVRPSVNIWLTLVNLCV